MKKTVLLLSLALVLVVGLSGCNFNGSDLSGTTWDNATMGTGNSLVFETATTGKTMIGILSAWSDWNTFTYTFDSVAQAGSFTIDGDTVAIPFTIDGNDMTVTYSATDVEVFKYSVFSH